MYNHNQIRHIHFEPTQRCQAMCSMCDRTNNSHMKNAEISINQFKQIIDSHFAKQLDSFLMCGNHGDPMVAKDTLDMYEWLRYHNSFLHLHMTTNGGGRSDSWWKDLAKVIGKNGDVTFSVDGLEDTNHLYRQNVNWKLVDQSMKAYIEGGGKVRWDYLIFDHNQHQVEEAEQYAKSIGVHKFQAKKTGRFITTTSDAKQSHQAVNRKGKETQELKKPDKKYQNKALTKQGALLEKYGSMDKYYDKVPVWCKVKDEGSLYISAEGLALPCCWTAGRMYKWWHKDPKVEQIWDFITDKYLLDARNGLDKVFETVIFDKIQNSWSKTSCDKGKLKVCSMKCGVEFDPFAEQFR